jgi:NAD(P)H-flavin reductase
VPISISGDPTKPKTLVHTIRAVGTVTRAMHELRPGEVVGVRGPFGKPWPVDVANDKDLLVVAGGIGLAPLRPVIYHALAHRDRYRRVLIAYGTRTPADILFDEQLIGWRGRFDLDVEVTVDRGDDSWRGKTGVVTGLLERADFDPQNAVAMMCGPEIMMRFAARELQDQGVGLDSMFVTLERNMQCAIAVCGHCQLGRELICRDGPVYRFDRVRELLGLREV